MYYCFFFVFFLLSFEQLQGFPDFINIITYFYFHIYITKVSIILIEIFSSFSFFLFLNSQNFAFFLQGDQHDSANESADRHSPPVPHVAQSHGVTQILGLALPK